MANDPEDLDKCFEVVSALVQQAGDVSKHKINFPRNIEGHIVCD